VRLVSPDAAVSSSLQGQLVHISGQVTTRDRLEDSEFLTGEASIQALSLHRLVT
jgi:hypothetical protein